MAFLGHGCMISGSRRNDSVNDDLKKLVGPKGRHSRYYWAQRRRHYGIVGPNLCARTCVRQEVVILGLMFVTQLLAAAMFVDKCS